MLKTLRLIASISMLTALTAFASMPKALPESQAINTEAIEVMHQFHDNNVSESKVAGVITLIAKNGKIVDIYATGSMDSARGTAMKEDTIVQIYSKSKTIVSTAVMQLVESGQIGLQDSIEDYIPDFKNMKVLVGGTMDNPELVECKNPITVKMLLTHTAGFAYGALGGGYGLIGEMYDSEALNPMTAETMEAMSAKLAALPLAFQPGEGWYYGMNIDILGHLIEVVSGQSLGAYLQANIFDPLGMVDTGFVVPEAKRDRVASIHTINASGAIVPLEHQNAGDQISGFEMGGGGLYSTITDYAVFAQMLLEKGTYHKQRILSRKSVEYMMSNHLAHWEDPTNGFSASDGFGIGGSVKINLSQNDFIGSIGQYGWSGAASTYYTIDPSEDVIFIYFSQHMPYDQAGLYPGIFNTFYNTLE